MNGETEYGESSGDLPSFDVATITETREVCDLCGNPRRKVRTYRVGYDGHCVKVTLCVSEHAKPLEKAIAVGSPVSSPSPKVKLWDMDEIERMKAAQQKRMSK